MKRSFVQIGLGLASIALLLAAACAPAAESKAPAPAEQKPAAEKPAAPKPAAEAPAAPKPAAEAPKPAAEKPAAPKASVSGIPLDPNAKFGGTLRVAYNREGPSFSPWEEVGAPAWFANGPMMNQLIGPQTWGTKEDFENQAYLKLHPDLAVSWEQSKDGLRWTLRLRDGIKWSDGTPFTCADAKWSLDAIRTGKDLKRSPRATHLLAVSDTQCPEALTLVVNLKRAKPGFLEVIGNPHFPILPKHRYDGKTDDMRNKPLDPGTGPFTLKEWVPGERYVLARKSDYWNKPFPYLDGVTLQLLTATAEVAALRAGRLDIGAITGYRGASAESLIKECPTCQVWPRVIAQGPVPVIVVNQQRPPWNTPEVKDAISLAIDRKKVLQLTTLGWDVPPSGGPFYPGSYWAMTKERLAQIPGYDFDNPERNKERARALLAQAGYKPNELTLPLSVGAFNIEDGPPIVQELKAVGFNVIPTEQELARTYAVLGAGDFNVFLAGFWDPGTDPDFILYEEFYTGSDRNYGRYTNSEVDRLINLQSITLDPEERRKIAWNAAEIVLREHAKIYVGFNRYAPIYGSRVRGFMPGPAHMVNRAPWHRQEHTWLTEQ